VQFIKKPLADICNASFASGIVPDRLKIAIVKRLHNKGNTGEVQNYGPIFLLSVFSKIVEKLMCNRLMSFITKNNILNDAQRGFREGKSTETATHAFLENIQKAIEKKINLIGIFFFTYQKHMMYWTITCGNKMPTRCNRGFYCRQICNKNLC